MCGRESVAVQRVTYTHTHCHTHTHTHIHNTHIFPLSLSLSISPSLPPPGKTRVAHIQRSCGYALRPTLSIADIAKAVKIIKEQVRAHAKRAGCLNCCDGIPLI